MTAQELDAFVRGALADLDAQRPGSARAIRAGDPRWEEAKAGLVSAVADKIGLPGGFVGELLARREAIGRQSPYNAAALRELADAAFVTALMAAVAWTAGAAASGKASRARPASEG
jgi:hypothetical protein